jgi:hypothetical protein
MQEEHVAVRLGSAGADLGGLYAAGIDSECPGTRGRMGDQTLDRGGSLPLLLDGRVIAGAMLEHQAPAQPNKFGAETRTVRDH